MNDFPVNTLTMSKLKMMMWPSEQFKTGQDADEHFLRQQQQTS
jgi:hypothetical protein